MGDSISDTSKMIILTISQLEGSVRDMNWNHTRCEGEQEERIHEMLSDSHIKKVLAEVKLTHNQYPEIIIFYQITCGGCKTRLTDEDPICLAGDYECDKCKYVTKTINGNLGYLGAMVPQALRDQFLKGFEGAAE